MPRGFSITLEEREQIQRLLSQGVTLSHIGPLLGRSRQFAYGEVERNGGRENYNAEKAHAKYALLRQRGKPKDKGKNLEETVNSLIFMINILTEEIKEIKRKYETNH